MGFNSAFKGLTIILTQWHRIWHELRGSWFQVAKIQWRKKIYIFFSL